MLFVKEPERTVQPVKEEIEQKEPEESVTFKEVLSNPVNKWVLTGTFFRNFGGSVISFYLPVFFLRNFAAFKTEYAMMNSIILSIIGVIGGLLGGVLADKYEKKNRMTKSLICIIGSASALPLIAAATLQTTNFWLSMACFSIFSFMTCGFSGPAIAMMQNTSPKKM